VEENTAERRVLNYWKGNYVQINKDMNELDWDSELAEDAWVTVRCRLYYCVANCCVTLQLVSERDMINTS